MSVRVIVLSLFALGAAFGTVFFAQSWMDAQRAAIAAQVPEPGPEKALTEVLVIKEDLSAGSFVKPEHMRWQAWPDDNLTPAYVIKGTRQSDEFVGAVVRNGISAGEPITDGRVVKPGDRGFLAAVLEPGKRAISVAINATTGISGFVFPGDRVDLILTHKIPARNAGDKTVRRASETVLTNIRVLAVDQTTENQPGEPEVAKTATIEVTPKEAEIVAVIIELGKLSLSLRSLARDDEAEGAAGARLAEGGGRTFTRDTDVSVLLAPAVRPTRSQSKGPVVNVVRGLKTQPQEVLEYE
ncbi:MAG: Flp pilus assembly protein CpaB [Alphaproteobacteria bacterium]